MDFLKKIGESVKQTGKTIVREIKTKSEDIRTKNRILNKLEMKDLKKLCKTYGIGEPSPYETDLITGERRRIKLTRGHYINYIMFRLNLKQIEEYCNRHRIDIWDIIREKEQVIEKIRSEPKEKIKTSKEDKVTKIEIKRQPEFDVILDTIENEFQDIACDMNIRDESEFRKQLVIFLRTKLPNKIEEEYKTSKGRLDILIDKKYVLELKYADNKGTLEKGIAEIKRYGKQFDNIAFIILDVNKLSFSILREYKNYYEEDGAQVIILRGRGSRKNKSKSTQIIIGKRKIRID